MSVHHRKIKTVTLTVDTTNDFSCQVKNWRIVPNTPVPDQQYTLCPDGAYREEPDPAYTLELLFLADWRENGISRFLTEHKGQTLPFRVDHHPDIPTDHVWWTGTLYVVAPPAGGEGRTTEQTELTLPINGEPLFMPEPEEAP